MMKRLDWDTVWMNVAYSIGERSRCDSRRVGAVIVTPNNRPVAVGYNGPPSGMPLPGDISCSDFCPRRMNNDMTQAYDNCVTVHAELNALLFADRREYEGGTLYVSSSTCWDCGKVVANSGVSRVVMDIDEDRDKHRNPRRTIEFLRTCGIDVVLRTA